MTLRACVVTEQNANTVAGVQVDTAVYVGTGVAGIPSLRSGREAPKYIIAGTQTANVVEVILDTFNAAAGDKFHVQVGIGSVLPGTSTIKIRNASTSGTVISTATGGSFERTDFFATFDGVQWR